MSNAIYIATTQPFSGKSVLALGMMHMLSGKTEKVGYFKPIVHHLDENGEDYHVKMIADHFKLIGKHKDMFSFTKAEALAHKAAGNDGFVIDTIIAKFKAIEEENDFVVVEGTDFMKEGVSFEADANLTISKNLGIPVILLVKGGGQTAAAISDNLIATFKGFHEKEIKVLAVVANKIEPEITKELQALLEQKLPYGTLIGIIPSNKKLSNPTMQEIVQSIGGKVILGANLLTNQVDKSIVGAMQIGNLLPRLKENALIIAPGDRGDIILAAMQANISRNYPKIAGIVLTGGIEADPAIIKLCEGLEDIVPIVQVKTGTFETVNNIGSTQSRIYPESKDKILLAIDIFEKHVDAKGLGEKIRTFKPGGTTPHMFQYQLAKMALAEIKHIVLAEGNDDRVLIAASRLLQKGLVRLTILGNPEEIAAASKRLGISLNPSESLNIIEPAKSTMLDDYVETLYRLRKSKQLSIEAARDLMNDVSYFGTMMVYKGDADGMVSGAVHTTQHTIRPALQFIKTQPGKSIVSSVFFMCLENRVCIFGDCAVNPNPDAEQLAQIALSAAESSWSFGIEPKVAMLSYSSGTSGEGEDVEKVRKATSLVRTAKPDLLVEGPIQYDAAVDPNVGKQKMPASKVAGQASVLVFPDLNTGNNTYKAVQRETGALAIGPMLQGLNKPVNDLSRGCTIDDIFNTVIITAIQAQQNSKSLSIS